MGGDIENPSYDEIGSDKTGYIEVVQVVFNENEATYDDLLNVFFECHDPTSWDYQNGDVGNLYRSVIFYHHEEHKGIAENMIANLNKNHKYDKPIVTQVLKSKRYVVARESDQHYYAKHSKA